MTTPPRRYRAGITDSDRWRHVDLREDDIVISTPSKCGTTWLQMICALLVFQRTELPGPLTVLSPWLDMIGRPVDEVLARLAAQQHRRFIKTHTPLDGLPSVPGVTYLVIGRNPLDVAVSIDHHRGNLDRETMLRVAGATPPVVDPAVPRRDRVLAWVDSAVPVTETMSTLSRLVWHLADAWARRERQDVVLVHYADLHRDLATMMRRIADRLGITVPQDRWDELVAAATLPRMRARADDLAPDERLGLFTDKRAFFGGRAAEWWQVLTDTDLAHYEKRLGDLAPPDLLPWLRDGEGVPPARR